MKRHAKQASHDTMYSAGSVRVTINSRLLYLFVFGGCEGILDGERGIAEDTDGCGRRN